MGFKKDLTGQRFGRLTVIEYAGTLVTKNHSRTTMWKCKCDCGNIKDVRYSNLARGTTQSCGCIHKEKLGSMNRTHGLSGNKTRLYTIWKNMRGRCFNTNDKSYDRYGGRGISVCEEWDKSFEAFYKWSIENGYKEDIAESNRNRLSIDRINNDGNYEPSNCRWTNDFVQASNKRNSIPSDIKKAICPICGNTFIRVSKERPFTCSNKCGAKYRSIRHNRGDENEA